MRGVVGAPDVDAGRMEGEGERDDDDDDDDDDGGGDDDDDDDAGGVQSKG